MGVDIWLSIELAENIWKRILKYIHVLKLQLEKSIAFQAEVEKLKEQIANEAIEREREIEEDRRKMQQEPEEAKIKIR